MAEPRLRPWTASEERVANVVIKAMTAANTWVYRLTGGRLPIVGCGGIATGADAYARIRAGASLVQLYSALVYGGPGLVAAITRELAACLQSAGFRSVAEAVGADHR